MQMLIDDRMVIPKPGQSLLDLVRGEGLDSALLSSRPLAAKIAGEVFTLNYIPLRQKDARYDIPNLRRAMSESGGKVRLLRYCDQGGKDSYIRTAWFIIFLALRQLWPQARAVMSCTLGESVYIQVTGTSDFSADILRVAGMVPSGIFYTDRYAQ